MSIFQLTEVNAPLVKMCVGLLVESTITVVQGRHTSGFHNQRDGICDIFLVNVDHHAESQPVTVCCVVYVIQQNREFKARIHKFHI